MKRPQSSGGTRRQVIPAQSSTTNTNSNNTTSRSNRSTTPQQQHPLLINSSTPQSLELSSDLSIKGIGNSKVNSSEERLRLEANNLITKWTTRDQQVQIKDNLILNTSLNNSSISNLSSSIKRTSSSARNDNPLLKSSNPITTKSIIESSIAVDQSSNQLLNTPLYDKIKDKRPSELSRWEKLRLSMERKKNVVDLNVLEPTFQSKIQLVKNDLINDDTLPSSTFSSESDDYEEKRFESFIPSSLKEEKKDLDSLFAYKPFSSETTMNSIEKPKFNDHSTTPLNNFIINNSLDQQMNIFKTKLLGTNYANISNTNNNTNGNMNNGNNRMTTITDNINNINVNMNKKERNRIEIPTSSNNNQQLQQQPTSSNYVTTQKEIFIAENEKRKAEEEVLKIKKQIEEEKSKLKQVQQIKKEELKSIKQNQQIKEEMEKLKQQQLKILKEHEKERNEMLNRMTSDLINTNNLTLKSKIFNIWLKKCQKRFQMILKVKTLFEWKLKKKAFKSILQNWKVAKEKQEEIKIQKTFLLEKKRIQAADQMHRSKILSHYFLKWTCQYKISRDRKIIEKQHLRRKEMMNNFIEKLTINQNDSNNSNNISNNNTSNNSNNNGNNSNNNGSGMPQEIINTSRRKIKSNNGCGMISNVKINDESKRKRNVTLPSTAGNNEKESNNTSNTSNSNNSNISNTNTSNNEIINNSNNSTTNKNTISEQPPSSTQQILPQQQELNNETSMDSISTISNHSEIITPNTSFDNSNTLSNNSNVNSTTSEKTIYLKKNSQPPQTPQFLKAMEERVNERKERWKQLQDKYKLQEEEKEDLNKIEREKQEHGIQLKAKVKNWLQDFRIKQDIDWNDE